MIELTLPDLSCEHCVRAVTRTVQRIDPQATVQVDIASKHVRIGSALPPAAFTPALAEEGYPPAA